MSRIRIPCPGCGKTVVVEITTIDTLRKELDAVTRERDTYRAKLAALETMKRNDPVGDMLRRMGL